MKQDKDFNIILDKCLERLFRGETVKQCLQSYPERAAELEPLLHTAAAVKKATAVRPNPVFRARAREQFHSALLDMQAKKGFHLFGLRSWGTAVAALVLAVVLLGGGGTVAAAGNSMPGEPLYQVKLAKEQIQLALTFSDMGKAELYNSLADIRVGEMVHVAAKGDSQQVELTTRRLDKYLTRVAVLVEEPSVAEGGAGPVLAPAHVTDVQTAAETPVPVSQSTPSVAPKPAPAPIPAEPKKPAITPGVTTVPPATVKPEKKELTGPSAVTAVETAPAPEVATEPTPEVAKKKVAGQALTADKRTDIKSAVKVKSAENLQRLRTALETAPQSARPALEKAIKETENSYRKVLESAKPESTAPVVPTESKEKKIIPASTENKPVKPKVVPQKTNHTPQKANPVLKEDSKEKP